MEISFVDFSVVVAANEHNPTILNQDWVDRNRIIPEMLGYRLSKPPIMTPPFSQLCYDDILTITFEPNKFTVTTNREITIDDNALVAHVAGNIVRLLEHVPYQGAGNNFKAVCEVEDARHLLTQAFIANKPNLNDSQFTAFKLESSFNSAVCNIHASAARLGKFNPDSRERSEVDVIAFDINCHRSVEPRSPVTNILEALSHYLSDRKIALQKLETITDAIVKS